jgi:hypothetical protein
MKADVIAKLVEKAECRIFGHEDGDYATQRAVLAALNRGFDHPIATIRCVPTPARKSTRLPNAVLVDPVVEVHVLIRDSILVDPRKDR